MEEPTPKPSGSNPASPRSTYSETDRSEVKTPVGLAPAVCASLLSAACGSHREVSAAGRFENRGMGLSFEAGAAARCAGTRQPTGPAPQDPAGQLQGRRPSGDSLAG